MVSALRVPGRYPQVESWAASVPIADLFVAATTIAEIERGVFGKERSDPSIAQAAQMTVATRHARHFEARLHEASDACMPLQPHASATSLIQAGRGGPGTSAAAGQFGGG